MYGAITRIDDSPLPALFGSFEGATILAALSYEGGASANDMSELLLVSDFMIDL